MFASRFETLAARGVRRLGKFALCEKGAVTIDWVALTAGILLLGLMVVFAVFNNGVAAAVSDVNGVLTGYENEIDFGDAPVFNGASSN